MMVRVAADVRPILLLLHEPTDPRAAHPFRDDVLAAAVNRRLAAVAPGVGLAELRLAPPADTGLSRWAVEWRPLKGPPGPPARHVSGRGDDEAALTAALPRRVVTALRRLNKMDFALSLESLAEGWS